MKAAVLVDTEELTVMEMPEPVPGTGDVVITVTMAGVCGTDYSLYKGKFDVPLPVVPGHEGIGIVKSTGPGVSDITVGQRVVIQPNFACRDCELCSSGMDNICSGKVRLGIDINGVFAEYVKVPARYVWPVPDKLDDRIAVCAEPLAVSAHALKTFPPSKGDRVLVIGAGVIGLMTLLLAKSKGAVVTISDLLDEHLSMAEKMGADGVLNAADGSAAEGSSFDLIYETSGAPSGLTDAIELAAPGGRIALLGLPGSEFPVFSTPIVRKELTIAGSMIYTDEFPEVLDLLSSGRVDPAPLISDVIGLESLNSAIRNFNDPDRLKVLVIP